MAKNSAINGIFHCSSDLKNNELVTSKTVPILKIIMVLQCFLLLWSKGMRKFVQNIACTISQQDLLKPKALTSVVTRYKRSCLLDTYSRPPDRPVFLTAFVRNLLCVNLSTQLNQKCFKMEFLIGQVHRRVYDSLDSFTWDFLFWYGLCAAWGVAFHISNLTY